ncbi:MAG: S24 family peptidase [Gammaproteobacteria bacterium]|nr:S24 family peptidase [Gammaproteobacteria bacterium]
MAPELPRRSVVIIDPTAKIAPGALVLAQVRGELYLRQLRCVGAGYELVALDGVSPALPLEGGLSAIRGVVVQRAGRRRWQHKHYRT